MICSNCGNEILNADDDCVDINSNHICSRCAESYFIRCTDCGGLVHESTVLYNEDGEPFCTTCYPSSDDDSYYSGSSYSSDKLEVKGYHEFDPNDIVFFGDTHNNSVPFLGVELEVDKGNRANEEMSHAIGAILPNNFIHFERDGSLNSGFENITQPATLEYHKSLSKQYREMFRLLIKNGYRSHNTKTSGLHVHFNRTFFKDHEDLYVTRLLFLIEKFWDELSKFSRRSMDSIHWAKKYTDNATEIIRKEKSNNLDRYFALNLTNTNTIEFRIFRGTLRYKTFVATLQLVDTMVRKARTITENELQSIKWEDLLEYRAVREYWETVKDREVK